MNTTSVDSFLEDGCGRCDKYRTPDCKVHRWTSPLVALRALVRESGLVETMKWGSPTYTLDGKNVMQIVALKDACALSFFKGAALDDPDGLLVAPGPNSRFARYVKFRTLAEVSQHRAQATRFIHQAIELHRAGVQIAPRGVIPEPMPDELQARLDEDPALAEAFDALTPGRQRSHILHVGGAKQSATRARRVEKCAPKIFAGKGFNER